MVTLLEINGAIWDIVFMEPSDDDAEQSGAGWYATRWEARDGRTFDTYTTEHYATRRELLRAVRAVR